MLVIQYYGAEYIVRIRSLDNGSCYFDLMGVKSLLRPAIRDQRPGAFRLTPALDRGLLSVLQEAGIITAWRRAEGMTEADFGPVLTGIESLDEVA